MSFYAKHSLLCMATDRIQWLFSEDDKEKSLFVFLVTYFISLIFKSNLTFHDWLHLPTAADGQSHDRSMYSVNIHESHIKYMILLHSLTTGLFLLLLTV